MKSGCWKNLSSAVCHIKYSHWVLSLLSVNRTASRGWPSSLLFLWLIWNGKYWALKWMPPNTRKKKSDLLMSPAGNVKCVFLTGLGQMYQISKLLLKDSLKHCLLYTEKIVWLAFVVAFFKTVIQWLICNFCSLFETEVHDHFLPFISWGHTRYFWGEWNDGWPGIGAHPV